MADGRLQGARARSSDAFPNEPELSLSSPTESPSTFTRDPIYAEEGDSTASVAVIQEEDEDRDEDESAHYLDENGAHLPLPVFSDLFANDQKHVQIKCPNYQLFSEESWGLFMPACEGDQVMAVYPGEISSMLAYTLSCPEYHRIMRKGQPSHNLGGDDISMRNAGSSSSSQTPTPARDEERSKGVAGMKGVGEDDPGQVKTQTAPQQARGENGLFGRSPPSLTEEGPPGYVGEAEGSGGEDWAAGQEKQHFPDRDRVQDALEILSQVEKTPEAHVEIRHATDGKAMRARFACKVFYAQGFKALRQILCNGDEEFINSLMRSRSWEARGGKSGTTWSKTHDERFILKQISPRELWSFLDFAPLYFQYLCKAYSCEIPTALAKILGIYFVQTRRGTKTFKKCVAVMENLFYEKRVTQVFDLKGSMRSRYVQNPVEAEVLLDENFLERMSHHSSIISLISILFASF